MKLLNQKSTFLLLGMLSLFLLSSCTANQPRNVWMDLPHAQELAKKKGYNDQKSKLYTSKSRF
jgi:hypothetical protein